MSASPPNATTYRTHRLRGAATSSTQTGSPPEFRQESVAISRYPLSQYTTMSTHTADIQQRLEPFKNTLWFWYIFKNYTLTETYQLCCEQFPQLQISHITGQMDSFPSQRSVRRSLERWGFMKEGPSRNQLVHQQTDKELLTLIWVYFYEMGLSDLEIQTFLLRFDTYSVTLRKLFSCKLCQLNFVS